MPATATCKPWLALSCGGGAGRLLHQQNRLRLTVPIYFTVLATGNGQRYLAPVRIGWQARAMCSRECQDSLMRCFKAKTLLTVVGSALVGATLYFILYAKLSPSQSDSWALDNRADLLPSNSRARSIQDTFAKWNDLKKFKAKMDEINNRNRNVGENLSYMYKGCSNSTNRYRQSDCSKTARDFPIAWPFHFPQPRYSLSTRQLLQSQWVTNLQTFLRTVQGKQVSVVTSSIEHTDILFNWLISAYLVAKPPLKNVLVLTLDKSLHDLAEDHGFASLYVSPEMVIDPKAQIHRVFSQVHVVRLAVLRLMNHYGYDVVNYDCDAILLKNPQTVFDSHKEADMIGTFGKGPNHLYTKWGVTLNTGVMLLRSNAKLGKFTLSLYCSWQWLLSCTACALPRDSTLVWLYSNYLYKHL